MNGTWGHCQHCRHFGSPAPLPLASEEAACRHGELARHRLTVFGSCGCTLFDLRAGVPEHAEQPVRVFEA